MLCRHQYRVLLQSDKALFHIGFIHTRWFEFTPPETSNYVTIAQGNKTYSSKPVYYIDQIRSGNVYTSTVKKKVDKRIEFGNTMSVAKTSVQIAVVEGATEELTGLLSQFIMKYRNNTGLNINEVQETFSYNVTKNNCQRQPLEPLVIVDNNSIPEISNFEYHKPKGRPPKRYKLQMEMTSKQNITSSSKTCSYCLEKGHNIKSCAKNKASVQ
ncbi:unnamed protein product [Rhizophagus irregularis]|uniref:Uncharacterized protein n=1 Tax=Rhizophagus irregularis TaxID=588596 RepID=A0A915ZQ69_9GLOM|nr:unnamed protein product [Rhizophagus irregularis]